MRLSNGAMRTPKPIPLEPVFATSLSPQPEPRSQRFEPRSVRTLSGYGIELLSLRMYTEEQVSEILQVSLSQLRKWRMKCNREKQLGPPFKKIGRLVRYPEDGLQAFING